MRKTIAVIALFAVSLPCFSADVCIDSPEYKNSSAIAKAANSDRAAQIGKAVEFLQKTKGLNFDQALKEVVRFTSPETVAYDNDLKGIGEKIQSMKPQSTEECTELIKQQRNYEAVGKEKIDFIVTKIMGK